jgi:hypothetical protein
LSLPLLDTHHEKLLIFQSLSGSTLVGTGADTGRYETKGFDHGAGHPLPLLCNAKAPNY